MPVSKTVTGLAGILTNLKSESKALRAATAGSIYVEGQQIMGESVKQTPVDVGRLYQSANVSRPKLVGEPVVTLSFGTDYALAVHERVEVPHVTGKAKFLEDPVNDAKRGYEKRVGDRGRKMYERGRGLTDIPDFEPEPPV